MGWVIRDTFSHILCTLSGLVECDDANGAEVFAMIMGCRELRKMEAINAIVEGDSFSAIQRGSENSTWPWRLMDWVEEIHHISGQLKCSFNHIL